MHPSVTQSLREEASQLAKQGDIAGAVAQFEEALTLDPKLGIEPEAEAKRIYAQALVEQGRVLAEQGAISGAVAKFEEALTLDPKLGIEPEAEAKRIYASALVEQGRVLAEQGAISDAVAKFEEALALDPSLDTDPEVAEAWNAFCWFGATWNQAALVLDACETAVKLAPEDGGIRDSRGLARALTGNVQGAIEDFEFVLEWAKTEGLGEEFIQLRTQWVEALAAGQDPKVIFDAATLEGLR
ncbi:MAG: tetratricopeptide repeat protein [Anaerolineae bacterium]